MATSEPVLLCLNLRRELIDEAQMARAAPALAELAETLATFRSQGWRVLHAYTVRQRSADTPFGALPNFEPAANEPVFALQGASALAETQVTDALAARAGQMAGGVFSRCGLATALAAQEQRVALAIVPDACFAPSVDAVAAHHFREFLDAQGAARLLGYEAWGANVICLDARRQ